MADIKTKLTLDGGIVVKLDILKGALGQDVTDIRTLGSKGMSTFSPSFTLTASCKSKITFIDGDEGTLLHRDSPIDQLVADSNYLEACYILLNGGEPAQEQYDEFKTAVTRHTMTHEQIIHLFHAFRRDSHPMAITCGITSALAAFYHDSLDVNNPRHREIATFRLLSKMPTTAAMCYKYSIGQPFVYLHNDLSYVDNSLNMMFSMPCEPYEVNPILERAMGRTLILHADHKQNASTSTVHIAGSSGASPFACIAAGIVSLWEPAHGGANEAALKTLEEASSVKHIPKSVRRAKNKSDSFRLMGFGHCIYRDYDPHATIVRETCHEVLKELGTKNDLLEVAMGLENITLSDPYFIEKKLYPSVDFYPGIILKATSIPSSMFTVIFVIARTVGWIAHWNGMHNDGMKIARPRQLHTEYERRDFKNDVKR